MEIVFSKTSPLKKSMYTISKLPITFFLLQISQVLYRFLKPSLHLRKNNFSGFETNSKKFKLCEFIPFMFYVQAGIG